MFESVFKANQQAFLSANHNLKDNDKRSFNDHPMIEFGFQSICGSQWINLPDQLFVNEIFLAGPALGPDCFHKLSVI